MLWHMDDGQLACRIQDVITMKHTASGHSLLEQEHMQRL